MQLVNIGFGNMVSQDRIISTRSVIVMDSGHIILSAVQPETIANRAESINVEEEEE